MAELKGSISKEGEFIKIDMPVINYKRGAIFISYCPMLDLMTYSENESSLDTNLDKTIDVFFDNEMENGTLHETLSELGWHIAEEIKKPENVSIPAEFFIKGEFSSKEICVPCL